MTAFADRLSAYAILKRRHTGVLATKNRIHLGASRVVDLYGKET
jgi:hypothetical protein